MRLGYEMYRVRLKQFHWKSINCALITCESVARHKEVYKSMLANSATNHKRLFLLCGMTHCYCLDKLEQECSASVVNGDPAERLLEAKRMPYSNEYMLLLLGKNNEAYVKQPACFDLRKLLIYIFNIWHIQGIRQDVTLSLEMDFYFPTEISADSSKVEVVIPTLLGYLVEHSKSTKISLVENLKNLMEDGYCLLFEIECAAQSEMVNAAVLQDVLVGSAGDENSSESTLCRSLVAWMNGSIEVEVRESHRIRVKVEIQLNNCRNQNEFVQIAKLSICPLTQTSPYKYSWTINSRPVSHTKQKARKVTTHGANIHTSTSQIDVRLQKLV